MDAALGLSVAHRSGFDGVSLRQVTEAAGISAPAFYHHFANTDELVDELVKRCLADSFAFFDDIWAKASFQDDPISEALRIYAYIVSTDVAEPLLFLSAQLNAGGHNRRCKIRGQVGRYIEGYLKGDDGGEAAFGQLDSSQLKFLLNASIRMAFAYAREIRDVRSIPLGWASEARVVEAGIKVLRDALRADSEHARVLVSRYQ